MQILHISMCNNGGGEKMAIAVEFLSLLKYYLTVGQHTCIPIRYLTLG